jgi:type IV pilus assembly protein PilW
MIARNRGFGLVEIMVGMAVGMISMIVIYQVYATSEAQKRATTTGSDAQTNGALALYLMEREIRAAGNGITEGEPQKYPPVAGCATSVYDDTGSYLIPNPTPSIASTIVNNATESSIRFAPAVVSDGGGGRSDSVTIVYGTSAIAAPYTFLGSYAPGAASIALTGAAGIRQNDMVVVVEEDAKAPNGNYIMPKPCSLFQVTGAPVDGVVPVVAGTRYNKAGGMAGQPTFSDNAKLYNLGQVNIVTYRVAANNLVADSTKFGVIPDGSALGTAVTNRTDFSPLASNIVNMQAQYGVDIGSPAATALNCNVNSPGISITTNDADGIVESNNQSWVDAATATRWENNGATSPSLLDLRRVRAVRVGLVARSPVKASGKPGDMCDSPPITIRWDSGPDMTPDLTGDPDWQCYRYKVFQTTIPIRNTIWSSTMNPANTANCGVRDLG